MPYGRAFLWDSTDLILQINIATHLAPTQSAYTSTDNTAYMARFTLSTPMNMSHLTKQNYKTCTSDSILTVVSGVGQAGETV